MKPIRCLVGNHDWDWTPARFKVGIGPILDCRCLRCGITMWQHYHLKDWADVQRRFARNGIVVLKLK